MSVSLISLGAAPLVLDDRGHPYLCHGDVRYRLRFYAPEEWAALPIDCRPVVSNYDPEFQCWIGLEPAFSPEDPGRSTR